MKRWIILFALAPVLGGGTGCNGGQESDEGAVSGQRHGLVSVAYEHDWSQSQEARVLRTTAQFIQFSTGSRDEVARLLALPIDPERDLPGPDKCRTYDLTVDLAEEATIDTESRGAVELLEAGDLKVETRERSMTLVPRHLPSLLPFISGVVYGEGEAALVEEAGTVKVSSEGGEAVGPFSAQQGSPSLPKLTQVAGRDPSSGSAVSRTDLQVRWQRSEEPSSDLLYIELRYSRAKREMALRCRPATDGAFTLPQSLLAEVGGKVTLEVSRLRRAFFQAAGLDRGELQVSVRDVLTLQL
jgi:hypothetical protein